MGADYYTELLDPQYAGRRWILTADAAAGVTGRTRRIIEAGAEAVMVVAGNEGAGPQPPDEVEVFVVGTTGTTLMEAFRAFAAALGQPSPELRAAIESFDPAGEATVLTNYSIPGGELAGRPAYGASRPEWKALEDKMVADDLWDRAGVDRAGSAIVDPTDEAAVGEALERLASRDGAVLVADNFEGWHGGAEYCRYVRAGADLTTTLPFFVERSRHVRIMPFLRGVPCSIHGLVTGERVLAFRPVEMLVFRRGDGDEFVYTGIDTVWDPPEPVRAQMRAVVRAVGARIRDEVGYRGAFGIDGVCTGNGFLPTELNARLAPGLLLQAEMAGGYPMGDIDRAVIAGLDLDLRPDRLEREIVEGADARRGGRWVRPLTHLTQTETVEQPIAYDGSTWRPADADDATATMRLGPAAQGALVRVALTERHGFTPGRSIAEVVAASFALADDMWDTRIGELVPGTRSGPDLAAGEPV